MTPYDVFEKIRKPLFTILSVFFFLSSVLAAVMSFVVDPGFGMASLWIFMLFPFLIGVPMAILAWGARED